MQTPRPRPRNFIGGCGGKILALLPGAPGVGGGVTGGIAIAQLPATVCEPLRVRAWRTEDGMAEIKFA
jgi:hypothetical protein